MLNGPSNEADNTELKNIALTVLIGKPDECRINNHRCRRQQQYNLERIYTYPLLLMDAKMIDYVNEWL